MQIGINLFSKWPYEEILAAFVENGIPSTFLCIDHPSFDQAVAAIKRDGLLIDNFHAPYRGQNVIWNEGAEGETILERFLGSVEQCVRHGVEHLVAHVSNGRPMPPISSVGLDRFDRFMEYAQREGVTVAFESHRYVENLSFILQRYPEAGFCLDTCHEDGFTPGFRYMPLFSNRLVATHLSDNEAVCDRDMHMLPFDGHIDFDRTAKEIADCGREVTLMLEIKPDQHVRYEGLPPSAYYKTAAERIRKISDLVESHRRDKGEG